MEISEYNKLNSKGTIKLLKKLIGKGNFSPEDENELKELIDYLSIINAFSYEDGMKLEIINHKNNPFTLWANDCDCRIVLWAGKCEEIYGHNKNDVIGEDFVGDTVDIVAKYERRKARIDCRDIIQNGKQYNNIAHDKTHDGADRIFQTNCFKIKDFFDPDKFYSAEIGVITNSIVEQTDATEKAIEHEKKIENLLTKISNYKEDINKYKLLATPVDKKKLQKIYSQLLKLELEHDEFEAACNKWIRYVKFCDELESEITKCGDALQRIKEATMPKNGENEARPKQPKDIV